MVGAKYSSVESLDSLGFVPEKRLYLEGSKYLNIPQNIDTIVDIDIYTPNHDYHTLKARNHGYCAFETLDPWGTGKKWSRFLCPNLGQVLGMHWLFVASACMRLEGSPNTSQLQANGL